MKVSEHFSRSEFRCKCQTCDFEAVDIELLKVLEDVRKFFNSAITINSACRCTSHNHFVGGSTNSKHLKGIAADIVVKGISPRGVYDYLSNQYKDRYGIGKYADFTHIDIRSDKQRWTKT